MRPSRDERCERPDQQPVAGKPGGGLGGGGAQDPRQNYVPEAYAHGLALALPERVSRVRAGLACPRGLRHAKSVLVPIHARDEWESAAGEDIA